MPKRILVVCLSLVSLSFVFAQSGSQDPEITGVQPAVSIDAQEKPSDYDYINDIEFRFCNKWLDSSLLTERDLVTIDSWENKPLCIVFFNRWDKPQSIYYWYSSAEIAPNNGMPMCGGDLGTWNFASMISISDGDTLTIPAGANVVKYDKLFLPPWIGSWIVHWCINFGLEKTTATDTTTMFSVQTRKAAGLDILVNWIASLKNSVSLDNQTGSMFITNKKIRAFVNADGDVVLSTLVKNEGNIDQIISMTGTISNFLGFQNKIATTPQTLGAYQSLELTHIIEGLPVYKGIFDIKVVIHHTPSFVVDVSSLSQDITQGGDLSENWRLFIFSRWFVGVIVLVLFFLIKIVKSFIKK